MQYKFHLNNLRIAPRKVRLITNLIKRSSILSALAQLKFQKKKATLPVLKLLKSAAASAINNFNLSAENLYVSNIFVDEGQKLKRFRPRAFGQAGAIHKKTSHITLILEERIMPGVAKRRRVIKEIKSEKRTIPEEKEKIEIVVPKEIKPTRKLGDFTRRIFRRKAIG